MSNADGLAFTFTKGIRAGVCVMATIGALSTLTVFLLLAHIVHVTFIPLISHLQLFSKHKSADPSTDPGSARVDLHSGSSADRKSHPGNPANPTLSQRQAQARRQTITLQRNRLSEERMFLRMQLGVFIFCLLLADFVQALGVLIQTRWAHLGGITEDTACLVQGVMITFGDVASGVWNTVIAVHTFATICLGKRMSTTVVIVTVILGWTIPILMNVLGPTVVEDKKRGSYYGVAGAWCFITNTYDIERALMHYMPMLIAALVITLMYIPVFLTLRGNLLITATSTRWYGYRISFRSASLPTPTGSTVSRNNSPQAAYLRGLARKMLWYPIVYLIVILPVIVCRFSELSGTPVSLPTLLACITLLFCMGISNVCIYFFTRNLGGIPWFAKPFRRNDVEIFVERTTELHNFSETGEAMSDNGGKRDRSYHGRTLSIPWEFDRDGISSRHSDPSTGVDDLDTKAKQPDEEASPTSKHELLHDLIFKNGTQLSSPTKSSSGQGGIRTERVGTFEHELGVQQAFHDTVRLTQNKATRGGPLG